MSRQPLNPAKLLHSKWTAAQPKDREKHFIVVRVLTVDDAGPAERVELEAVLSRRSFQLPWRELTAGDVWLQGWQ